MRHAYQYSVYTTHERKAMALHLWARRRYLRTVKPYQEWMFSAEQINKLEAVCKTQSN